MLVAMTSHNTSEYLLIQQWPAHTERCVGTKAQHRLKEGPQGTAAAMTIPRSDGLALKGQKAALPWPLLKSGAFSLVSCGGGRSSLSE
jgi:hypothetical protein